MPLIDEIIYGLCVLFAATGSIPHYHITQLPIGSVFGDLTVIQPVGKQMIYQSPLESAFCFAVLALCGVMMIGFIEKTVDKQIANNASSVKNY